MDEALSLTGFAVDDTKARAVGTSVLQLLRVAQSANPAPADLLAGLGAVAAQVIAESPHLSRNPDAAALAVADEMRRLASLGGPFGRSR